MGESYQDLLDRLLPSLRSLVKEETEAARSGPHSHSLLLVTHSGVIMSLMAYLNNTPFPRWPPAINRIMPVLSG